MSKSKKRREEKGIGGEREKREGPAECDQW